MQALLAIVWLGYATPTLVAYGAGKTDAPPHAILEFSRDRTLKEWATTFELTTASGSEYVLHLQYGARGNSYDSDTLTAILTANWIVESAEDGSVRVYGTRTKEGKADAVKSLTLTNQLVRGMGRMPALTAVGKVEVKVELDEGKRKPAPDRQPRATGPVFPNEPFVEFDLTTLPAGAENVGWKITFDIRTTAGKEEPWIQIPIEVASINAATNITALVGVCLADCAFKGEVVGKTKIRVYGGIRGDRFYPAVHGTVTSPDLKPAELPKVTNPKRL